MCVRQQTCAKSEGGCKFAQINTRNPPPPPPGQNTEWSHSDNYHWFWNSHFHVLRWMIHKRYCKGVWIVCQEIQTHFGGSFMTMHTVYTN